jgi:hypothetical protein
MYTCTHWNSADVPGFFSDGALCFFLIFFVILLACGVSVCACVSTRIRKSPVLELAVPVSELAGFLAILANFSEF